MRQQGQGFSNRRQFLAIPTIHILHLFAEVAVILLGRCQPFDKIVDLGAISLLEFFLKLILLFFFFGLLGLLHLPGIEILLFEDVYSR